MPSASDVATTASAAPDAAAPSAAEADEYANWNPTVITLPEDVPLDERLCTIRGLASAAGAALNGCFAQIVCPMAQVQAAAVLAKKWEALALYRCGLDALVAALQVGAGGGTSAAARMLQKAVGQMLEWWGLTLASHHCSLFADQRAQPVPVG